MCSIIRNYSKQNNMKNFDYAAAERGAKVCTRGGSPVRILSFDCRKKRKGNVLCPIVAEVFFKDDREFKDGNWAISDYDQSGRFHGIGTTSEYDLMMAYDDYLEKLERGEYSALEQQTTPLWQGPHRIMTPEQIASQPFVSISDEGYWRKMYAGMAMQGLLARFCPAPYCSCSNVSEDEFVASDAAKYADALIEELKKTPK